MFHHDLPSIATALPLPYQALKMKQQVVSGAEGELPV